MERIRVRVSEVCDHDRYWSGQGDLIMGFVKGTDVQAWGWTVGFGVIRRENKWDESGT